MLDAEYKTVAFLRYHEDEPQLDGFLCAKWPKGLEKDALNAICLIEEIDDITWLKRNGFEEAVGLVEAYPVMQLRARFNQMRGPYVFTTEDRLDEETTLALVLDQRRKEKQSGRR